MANDARATAPSVFAEMISAGLGAVSPDGLVRAALASSLDLAKVERVFVLAAGKAAGPMARAAEDVLDDRLEGGVVIVKDGHGVPLHRLEVFEASHPLPDERGVRATQRLLQCANEAGPDDLVLVLLSGGASALLTAPVPGVSLEDLRATTSALLDAGAPIHAVNCIRKHLSIVKGGQLAGVLGSTPSVSLVLSDVVGSSPDVVASGPTAPDPTTFEDAWSAVEQWDLRAKLPGTVVQYLQRGRSGEVPETPKPGDCVFDHGFVQRIGDNALAAGAMAELAAQTLETRILTTSLEGEAREVGRFLADVANTLPPNSCRILGGESTVTVSGDGMGGRNQELALAAAIRLVGSEHLWLMAFATDGGDGPTDAAGAIVSGHTIVDVSAARRALANNDAYRLLDSVGALLRTGATLTNVNDLVVMIRTRHQRRDV